MDMNKVAERLCDHWNRGEQTTGASRVRLAVVRHGGQDHARMVSEEGHLVHAACRPAGRSRGAKDGAKRQYEFTLTGHDYPDRADGPRTIGRRLLTDNGRRTWKCVASSAAPVFAQFRLFMERYDRAFAVRRWWDEYLEFEEAVTQFGKFEALGLNRPPSRGRHGWSRNLCGSHLSELAIDVQRGRTELCLRGDALTANEPLVLAVGMSW